MGETADVEDLAERYGQYPPEAYVFVGEGLRHAAKRLGRDQAGGVARHLVAQELVEGVLELAASRYGLLGRQVLRGWNLRRSEDIGRVTFHLIEQGVFGKQPSDSEDDFATGPDFAEVIEGRVRSRLERTLS